MMMTRYAYLYNTMLKKWQTYEKGRRITVLGSGPTQRVWEAADQRQRDFEDAVLAFASHIRQSRAAIEKNKKKKLLRLEASNGQRV